MKFLQSKIRVVALLGIALFGIVDSPACPRWGRVARCATRWRGARPRRVNGVKPGDSGELVPPIGIMVLGVGFAFRYGKRRDEDQERGEG